jgi:hypothetical protein
MGHSIVVWNKFKNIERFELDVHNCRNAVKLTSNRNGITRQDNHRCAEEYVSMASCRWLLSLSS